MIIKITYVACGPRTVTQRFNTDAEYNILQSSMERTRKKFKTNIFLEACKDARDILGKPDFYYIEQRYYKLVEYYAEIERHFLDFGD